MREDHFTNTEADAAAYERVRSADDYEPDAPTLAEATRDEADTCRPVVVDGEVIRVHGGAQMNPAEVDAFADIVRAAKRLMAEQACPDCDHSLTFHDPQAGCRVRRPTPCPCATRGHR